MSGPQRAALASGAPAAPARRRAPLAVALTAALAAALAVALTSGAALAQSGLWRQVLPSSLPGLPAPAVPSIPAAVAPNAASVQTVGRTDLSCEQVFQPTTPLDAGLVLGAGAAGGLAGRALQGTPLGGLLGGGGSGLDPNQVRRVLMRSVWLPVEFEVSLGERLATDLPMTSAEEAAGRRNAERYTQVAALFDRLVRALPAEQPYRFRLAFGDEPGENAAALPGGTVIVQQGLLRREPELVVGVLAHEMAHVLQRHQTRHYQSLLADSLDAGTLVRLSLGGRAEFDRAIGAIAGTGNVSRRFADYHADQELEADACMPRLAKAAGFDPVEVARAFAQWTLEASSGGAARGPFELRHPASPQRASVLASAAAHWAGRDATIARPAPAGRLTGGAAQ